jgi:hypothetical protein
MKSMVLKGEAMMADPGYKKRHKEFQAKVNPKPDKAILDKQLQELHASQGRDKDLIIPKGGPDWQ